MEHLAIFKFCYFIRLNDLLILKICTNILISVVHSWNWTKKGINRPILYILQIKLLKPLMTKKPLGIYYFLLKIRKNLLESNFSRQFKIKQPSGKGSRDSISVLSSTLIFRSLII